MEQRLQSRDEAQVRRRAVRVVQLTHRFVDQAEEIGSLVGHRRIDRDRCCCKVLGHETAPGGDNRILQNYRLGFLLLRGPAAHQNTHCLFEVEQPERKLEIVDIDEFGDVAERCAVFVMRIKQHNMRLFVLRQYRQQQQCDCA